jgi:hypothetical protein
MVQLTFKIPSFLTNYLIMDYLLVLYTGSRFGGVVIGVLVTGPRVCWFEPDRSDWFLMAIKIRSTPTFVWEIKPEIPRRNILRQVKDLLKSHGDR